MSDLLLLLERFSHDPIQLQFLHPETKTEIQFKHQTEISN